MNVLLIWEVVPEYVKLYLIESPTEEQLELLEKANGFIINVDGDEEKEEASMKINDMLAIKDDYCQVPGESYNCIWVGSQVKTPYKGKVDRVYRSGFAL